MRGYADYANLHARIYALRSRLLSLTDYAALTGNPDETLHGRMTGHFDPATAGEIIFREQIANLLPLAFSVEIYAPLFLAFFRQFEAQNAKLILTKAFGLPCLEQWYDIEPYAILKRDQLGDTTDLQMIRPLLTGTYLADALEDVSSYGQMEIRVDLCAAKIFYEASVLFSREAQRDFQELMGRRIAVTSTMLSLRLKKTYQWDDEKIRFLLEKFHDAFGGKIRPQVKIVEEALDRHLRQARAGGAPEPSVEDVDLYLEQYYYGWISSLFHRDFHSIYGVFAYLWLLFYQIRNLFKIIEGRRFGFTPEQIMSRIVCNA